MRSFRRALSGAVQGLKDLWNAVTERSMVAVAPEPADDDHISDNVPVHVPPATETPTMTARAEVGPPRITIVPPSPVSPAAGFVFTAKPASHAAASKARAKKRPTVRAATAPTPAATPVKSVTVKKAMKSGKAVKRESGRADAKKPMVKKVPAKTKTVSKPLMKKIEKSGKARKRKSGKVSVKRSAIKKVPAKKKTVPKPAVKKVKKSEKARERESERAGERESGRARKRKSGKAAKPRSATPVAKKAAKAKAKKPAPAKKPPAPAAKKRPLAPRLEKHDANPILGPSRDRAWESKAVFNPAAAMAGGKVHVLYRAIGDDDVSVLGYASSEDGVDFTERLDMPVYVTCHEPTDADRTQNPVLAYGSGGGWNGGCEDPRLTFIGDDAYLLFTAFDGWGSVRIGMTSIAAKDFLNKRWRWRPRALLSPPGEIHKNWVLFPEKIRGKYAMLTSISPRIQITYLDNLKKLAGKEASIKSLYEKAPRGRSWDSWVRGAGPPPIRTERGWLLLYHAMDDRDPGRYKLGAMLLDLKDPTKVIARSKSPILEPDEPYENEGFKSGVVYCCGAVIKAGRLIVYYGGADTVVCAAEVPLNELLDSLSTERPSKLSTRRGPVKRKPHDPR